VFVHNERCSDWMKLHVSNEICCTIVLTVSHEVCLILSYVPVTSVGFLTHYYGWHDGTMCCNNESTVILPHVT
jgi:hypothetical protein